MEPITRHGVFAARFNDLFTDGLRVLKLESMGYRTSVVEYISPARYAEEPADPGA